MTTLITTKVAPWVTISPEFPRYHRTPANATGAAGFIDGLIGMYAACGGPAELATAVEIGAWTGESSEIAAQMVASLTCVDPWEHANNHEQQFDARMARFRNVRKLTMRSVDVAPMFEDGSVDLVYIDGRHEYKHVRNDILAWLPKIKLGGWITGHDFDDNPTHAGVVKAVDEFLGVPDRLFTDHSWLFQKTPELVARFEKVKP